jgi:hypothetical protein
MKKKPRLKKKMGPKRKLGLHLIFKSEKCNRKQHDNDINFKHYKLTALNHVTLMLEN